MGSISKFRRNKNGNVGIVFAVASVAVVGAVGVALDYSDLNRQRSDMQNVADSAALATVRAFGLLEGKKLNLSKLIAAYVDGQKIIAANGENFDSKYITFDPDTASATVTLSKTGELTLAKILGRDKAQISVKAVATAVATPSACVIALDPVAPTGIKLSTSGAVEAGGCAIWSNSTSPYSISGGGSGYAKASMICSAGGVSVGSGFTFSPSVYKYCSPIADPLETYVQPVPGTCQFSDLTLAGSGAHVLNPGVYCGGIRLQGSASVEFKPGIYHIVGGALKIGAGATATGSGVTFVASGAGSSIDFTGSASITLSAPTSGITEGILFSSARNGASEESNITGSTNLHIEGAIYLPTHNLKIAGKSTLSIPPTHSLLIAGTLHFASTLVEVRSDYEAATMKAPAGVAYTGIRLAK